MEKLNLDLKEIVFQARAHEYDEFLSSPVWDDLSYLLRVFIESGRDFIESEKEHLNIVAVQGEITAARYLACLPAAIRNHLINESLKERNKENDERESEHYERDTPK